ncbi:unnamed protein product [Urochloa humidicola]
MAQDLAPIKDETFDVMISGSYGTFMGTLRTALAGDEPTMIAPPSTITKVKRPVLAKETGEDKQPPRWIHVKLNGKNGAAPKVAIRSDNAYIIGFTNSQGTWFQLSKSDNEVNLVSKNPPPEMAGFDGNYNTLIKPGKKGEPGGVDGLPRLNLNKFSTADAAGKLWNHKKGAKDDVELKKAIATLAVVLCEAARFTPVYDVINKGWGNDKVSITTKEVGFIKNWGDLSTQLLKWKDKKYTGDADLFDKFPEIIGIKNGKQALDAVQLVKLIIRSNSLLAWLKYFWGLLVKKLYFQKEDTAAAGYEKPTKGSAAGYEKPTKGSAAVNPL